MRLGSPSADLLLGAVSRWRLPPWPRRRKTPAAWSAESMPRIPSGQSRRRRLQHRAGPLDRHPTVGVAARGACRSVAALVACARAVASDGNLAEQQAAALGKALAAAAGSTIGSWATAFTECRKSRGKPPSAAKPWSIQDDAKLLYLGEGMNSTVAVTEHYDGMRYFHVGGKVEASSGLLDMRLQRMLGHLSALLHPKPKTVLIVGCGSGGYGGHVRLVSRDPAHCDLRDRAADSNLGGGVFREAKLRRR